LFSILLTVIIYKYILLQIERNGLPVFINVYMHVYDIIKYMVQSS